MDKQTAAPNCVADDDTTNVNTKPSDTDATSISAQEERDIEKNSTEDIAVEEEVDNDAPELTGAAALYKSDSAVARVISRFSDAPSVRDPGPPPDGGAVAWTQVALGHLALATSWGYINTFGVFQSYYETHLGVSSSSISWIGALQLFVLFAIAAFSGRAFDAGFFKLMFIAGSFFQLLGVFAVSFATEYWQVILAQGVCTGLGNGLMFTPTVALVSTYFSKRRALAIATVATGTATGGMLFPGIVSVALPAIGFPWTVRILGFIMLIFATLGAVGMRSRLPPRRSGPMLEFAALKEPTFALFSIGMCFNYWALYFAFYYLGSFAVSQLGLSYKASINLLIVLNGVGALGRLIPAYLADRFVGPLNMLIPAAFIASLLLFCWTAVDSVPGLYVFAVIYGFPGATLQGLWPATLASLTPDIRKTGGRVGIGFTSASIFFLTGPPLGGALVSADNGSYVGGQVWAGGCMAIGTGFLLAARISKTGWKLKARV